MLIIKSWMSKVKKLNPFKPQKWKKGGNFNHGCKKNPSVVFWLDFNQNFVLFRMKVI